MVKEKFRFLHDGTEKFSGTVDYYSEFVTENQLKNKALWDKFVNVFKTHADDADEGWRGEYFGKTMRGACLTYRYSKDEELYKVLEDTVRNLLTAQDEYGRITTYSVQKEFCGWDMWTRKYVLTGLLHFYDICRDEDLKKKIIAALCRHADYIISKVGDGSGKISVLDTSRWYGGLNSSSILEPFVGLYNVTGETRYLDFAKYLLEKGGCKGGNLLELAEKGEKYPYQYPEVKAYEMTSYFEGAAAYYCATGEKRYLDIAIKYCRAVLDSDVTIIGCAGCTHELFDNSAEKQTEETENGAIMQETCVTVTLMRFFTRLLAITGDVLYADETERSAYNALYGSVNVYGNDQFCREENKYLPGVTFDSYSPLVNKPRGIGIGGFKKFSDGTYYGCCACIGSAGTGLFPLSSVMNSAKGQVFNFYHDGMVSALTPGGQSVRYTTEGEAVISGKNRIILSLQKEEEFELVFRIPRWCKKASVTVCGERKAVPNGYYTVKKLWKNGDVIELELPAELKAEKLNGKTAFCYGAIVLARDELKENTNISESFTPVYEDGKLVAERVAPEKDESLRFILKTKEGSVLLTDYASCGKKWNEKNARISVWLNAK